MTRPRPSPGVSLPRWVSWKVLQSVAGWRLNPAGIEELQVLQRQLLNEAVQLIRPSGRLVYATCTVHPGENQAQIDALLNRHPHWRQCLLPEQLQRLCGHSTQLQLWPHRHGCDGFFAVALEPVITIQR